MNNLERKVDLIIELLTAQDAKTKEKVIERIHQESITPPPADLTRDDVIQSEIEEVLKNIGVPCSVLGYPDMTVALTLIINNPDYANCITKCLYPEVAKIRGGDRTPARVERSIRHAIEIAWDRGDLDVLYRYFGNTVSSLKGKPTNSQFLAQVAHHIRRKLR